MKDLAIVLHTCDAYEFLLQGWAHCWNKFQKHTSLDHSPLYFLNEEKPVPPEMIETKCIPTPTGKGEWSDRLIRGLVNIPEPYVLYMQEDFWLKDVLTDFILEILMYWAQEGDAVRIMGSGEKLINSLAPPTMGEPLQRFAHKSPYFFGHAATIWYKPHLMSCLGPGEDPWRNCHEGNLRCWNKVPLPIHYHYPFEWYHEVHNNVKRTKHWKYANGDRSLPGELSWYGDRILKEISVDY